MPGAHLRDLNSPCGGALPEPQAANLRAWAPLQLYISPWNNRGDGAERAGGAARTQLRLGAARFSAPPAPAQCCVAITRAARSSSLFTPQQKVIRLSQSWRPPVAAALLRVLVAPCSAPASRPAGLRSAFVRPEA